MMSARPNEESLVAAFLAARPKPIAGGRLLREFTTLAGVPDVVCVEPAQKSVDLDAELAVARGVTNGRANVLSCLSKSRAHALSYVVSHTGLQANYVKRILGELRQMGLVEVTGRGSVLLSREYHRPKVRFTAMEFKLSDWRRALAQAVRHRAFAQRTLVVMPFAAEDNLTAASSAFSRLGVGCAVFDMDSGRMKVLVRPAVRRRTSDRVFLDAVGRVESIDAKDGEAESSAGCGIS